MRITTSPEGRNLLLSVKGRILIGESAISFKDVLIKALQDGGNEGVIIDLAGVDYIDSTGLGELIGHLSLFKDAGKKLILRNPAPRIMALIRLARLDTFLPVENPPPEPG